MKKHTKAFTRTNPCPVCGGHEKMERGKGTRCYGFLSDDENYAHCTREQYAGGLPLEVNGNTYCHRLVGDCHCGTTHNPFPDSFTASPKVVETYDYVDEHGEMLFQVCRKNPKGFFQRKPDGKGGWQNTLNGVRRVLYRLPELLEAAPSATVYVCEGEKDADALRKIGLVATTSAGGAGKWRYEYNEHLRGRNVVILPDNDGPGREHAEQVSKSLGGFAASVKVLRLSGLPEKGDVSDWLKAGGTAEQLVGMANDAAGLEDIKTELRNANILSAEELLAREIPEPKYAINGLLSEGVTIFAGKPKLGKSWFCLNIAVAVACGGHALGTIPVQQGDVLYLTLEDGERRLQDRLIKVLGNGEVPKRLHFATRWQRINEGGLDALDEWLTAHPETRLVIIDTLKRVRKRETGKRQLYDVDYEAIEPLADLGHKHGIGIVVVHHSRKQDSEDPLDLISGSFGLSGSADGALVLKRGRGDDRAELHSTGRDFEESKHALAWDKAIYGWKIVGDVEDLVIGKERREIRDLVALEGSTTPKEVATILKRSEGATRKIMAAMHRDGQLANDGSGRYSIPANTKMGNSSNSGNSSNLGNSGNYQSDEPSNSESYPLFAPGNGLNGSNVRHIADRVTRVTEDTNLFGMNDETAERAAILEYEANLPREEAERLARTETASLRPEISGSEFAGAVAA